MSIFNQRNNFFFDHGTGDSFVRLWASTMDLRPYLQPTGWVLYIRGNDENEMAEYGIAYSPEAAQIHAEGAKSRYLRKRDFGGKYEKELNPRQRAELKEVIQKERWQIVTHAAMCTIQPSEERIKTKVRAAQLQIRDQKRLKKLTSTRRITVARKGR